ncbi:CsgG/HfaB family protein [Chitinimonas lacunae]|uniref:CsgG/HfaB family protein n=1 Tax=Chitinimonas lacunae TaxID=1963018 RepID=A0ABV8MSM9_9NEIS
MRVPSMILLTAALALTACGEKTELGQGGSIISGSAGSAGTRGAARELVKCQQPVATVALVEDPNRYGGQLSRFNLPESPLPLLRLLMQQSGCFRVVDRAAGLAAAEREQELADKGVLRPGQTVRKQRGIEAQYSITPNLAFSETKAGEQAAGIAGMIPGLAEIAGAVAGVTIKEAQVVLFLTDNETTEQLSAAEGSARITDLGAGGLAIGGGGAGALGWESSNEGKVIAAAMLDAINKLVPQTDVLARKSMPPPVATRADAAKP